MKNGTERMKKSKWRKEVGREDGVKMKSERRSKSDGSRKSEEEGVKEGEIKKEERVKKE